MTALNMMITDAGLDALVDAQNGGSDEILISDMGLTDTPFTLAPTLTTLPGQFKMLAAVSGETVAENMIHLTAYDTSQDVYDVTGFGLFLSDGTLFAAYSSNADPILSKAQLATALFAHDIAFVNDVGTNIAFGNAIFSYPPATQTVRGVAKLATQALAGAGTDDQTIMTPALVKYVLDTAIATGVINPNATQTVRGMAKLATQALADAGTDDQTIMTPALVKRILDAALPAGIINLWSGAVANIPAGWLLCNGANGTPDLRDRFIVGAGGGYNKGSIGGAASHSHGGTVAGHALTINEMPLHNHGNGVIDDNVDSLRAYGSKASPVTGGNIQSNGFLNNTQGNTEIVGGGQTHDHDLTINTASTLPPYFALAYIMKA